MRSVMPRVSRRPTPTPSPVPPHIYCPRRRITPSTSRRRASTTMPATLLPRPYRRTLPSCRRLHASPRSWTSLRLPKVRSTRPVSIRGVLVAAAVRRRRIAACCPRPKGHRTFCHQTMRTSRSLLARTWAARLRACIRRDGACHTRQNPRRHLRRLPSQRRIWHPPSSPPAIRPSRNRRHHCWVASAISLQAIRRAPLHLHQHPRRGSRGSVCEIRCHS